MMEEAAKAPPSKTPGAMTKTGKRKLTKAEKRELKFAGKRGQDLDTVDLTLTKENKKHKVKHGGYQAEQKKGPTSNKFSHFAEMDLDSHT